MTSSMRSILNTTLTLIVLMTLLSSSLNAQADVSAVPSPEVVGEGIEQVEVLSTEPAPVVVQTRQCFVGDVWEVYTRHMPCCMNKSAIAQPNFRVYHIENKTWKPRNIDELFAATSEVGADGIAPLTIFYVHGNWMTEENTRERVQIINRTLSRYATRPYRLVLLSWPSEREPGIVSNIRENAACADVQAHYLSYLVNHVSPASQVSMLGFSFGGRTVTGALHLLGGGAINGIGSPMNSGEALPQFRVTLVAPAVDRNWISPNGRFNAAPSTIDAMVNLYNSQDPVLRRFRFINSVNNSIAAGFRGFGLVSDPRSTRPLDMGDIPIQQFDCGSLVGNSHDEKSYYSRCSHFVKGIKNLFWEDI